MKRVERIKDAHRYAYPHLAHSNMQNEFTIMLLFTNEIVNWTSCCGLLVMKNEEEEEEEEAQKQVINIMLHCFRTHSRKLCPRIEVAKQNHPDECVPGDE